MAFTHPPYNVNYQVGSQPIANDNLRDQFEEFLSRAYPTCSEPARGAVYTHRT